MDRLRSVISRLDRDDRKALVERVEAGARVGPDFIVMMILSSGLASLGLLEDSTAVVIGAMLVAPLMGPLIGGGLALMQGNIALFRDSMGATMMALLVGLTVSIVVGVLNPGFEPSLEVEARGSPDVLDLGIAVLSGFVAAYALGRPSVANTLAGVAIAAALVPPLCVVGIGFTNDRPEIAANSAILLLTNLVAITLAAAVAFALLGIRESAGSGSGWPRRVILVLVMMTLLLMVPLISNVAEQKRREQVRPLTYPVASHVQEAIADYIDSIAGVRLITIARVSVEPASSITVLLAVADTLPAGLKEEVDRLVRQHRGGNPDVRIIALREVTEQPTAVSPD